MDYTRLADQVYALYSAFCDKYFTPEQALDLTKFCMKEFPIFKTLIPDHIDYI